MTIIDRSGLTTAGIPTPPPSPGDFDVREWPDARRLRTAGPMPKPLPTPPQSPEPSPALPLTWPRSPDLPVSPHARAMVAERHDRLQSCYQRITGKAFAAEPGFLVVAGGYRQRIDQALARSGTDPRDGRDKIDPVLRKGDGYDERALSCACIVLAGKYMQEETFRNRDWGRLLKMEPRHLNKVEAAVLRLVDYDLHVPQDVYRLWSGDKQP